MAGLFNFTSCTEDSLSEQINEPPKEYASEGEEDPNNPSDDPPGDGN